MFPRPLGSRPRLLTPQPPPCRDNESKARRLSEHHNTTQGSLRLSPSMKSSCHPAGLEVTTPRQEVMSRCTRQEGMRRRSRRQRAHRFITAWVYVTETPGGE
ncbi:hypothetical protein NDU88_003465 [Pleurodeles waltl]|uniref:Uncharacterized protein n=1 Tax=Pleurodeles waltl TaxID=8319 RepID=A0AAV7WTP9_PLEWA|nr:hypothetical protein NDU88_003465 [Pleurodeles waltl]